MRVVTAEMFHPLAGFSDEAPTANLRAPTTEGVIADREPLPVREHGVLTFVEGSMAGAVVLLHPGGSVVLGRGASAQVHIAEGTVSRAHACIRWDGAGYVIEDLGSTGTWVNGWKVEDWRPLPPGARVQLGPKVRLRFDLYDAREQQVIAGLYDAAMRDALTGAYTRRYLCERLHAELSYAARHRTPLALVMIDIDRFKPINDRLGHQAGDTVLRIVSKQLRRLLRPEDVLVRYGGDELCVLLRGLDARNAALLAERLRLTIGALRIPVDEEVIGVTVSIGVAASEPWKLPESVRRLVERADRALYRAKHGGRDRTCTDPPPA